MSLVPYTRWSGYLLALGGLSLVFCELMVLGGGSESFHDPVITAAERVTTICFFVGAVLLTLGLPGVYLVQARQAGRLGLGAYFTALAGSAMMIASDWSDLFVQPALVRLDAYQGQTPDEMVVGFLMNYGIYTLGWLLMGIAGLRARVLPRPLSLLLIGGALLPVLTILTGSIPGEFLPLYLAFSWLGLAAARQVSVQQAPSADLVAA